MSKYTRGPWVAQGNKVYAMSDCVHHPVASTECNHTCRDEFDQEANARLIAAAPMMLELLKRLLPIAEDAAESLGRFCSDEGWAQEDMDRMDNVEEMVPLMRAAIKAVEEGK